MISYFEKYIAPASLSIGLHGALLAFLFFGFAPEAKPPQVKTPNFVQAKLVKLEDQSKSQKPADKPKVVDPTQKRKEQERIEQQKKQQELKRKQQEAEKQKAEAERKKKEQEKKVQDEAARKAKAEADRKAAEAERKAKAEAEKKQQELARKEREKKAFEAALAQEQARLEEESFAVTAQSYMSAIAQRVIENWSRPPSARNGMQCILLIRLVPTGRVVSVDVLKGSGNTAFDLSAVQAVKKVEQFEEVKEMPPEVFERHYREFELNFNPQDLRQ